MEPTVRVIVSPDCASGPVGSRGTQGEEGLQGPQGIRDERECRESREARELFERLEKVYEAAGWEGAVRFLTASQPRIGRSDVSSLVSYFGALIDKGYWACSVTAPIISARWVNKDVVRGMRTRPGSLPIGLVYPCEVLPAIESLLPERLRRGNCGPHALVGWQYGCMRMTFDVYGGLEMTCEVTHAVLDVCECVFAITMYDVVVWIGRGRRAADGRFVGRSPLVLPHLTLCAPTAHALLYAESPGDCALGHGDASFVVEAEFWSLLSAHTALLDLRPRAVVSVPPGDDEPEWPVPSYRIEVGCTDLPTIVEYPTEHRDPGRPHVTARQAESFRRAHRGTVALRRGLELGPLLRTLAWRTFLGAKYGRVPSALFDHGRASVLTAPPACHDLVRTGRSGQTEGLHSHASSLEGLATPCTLTREDTDLGGYFVVTLDHPTLGRVSMDLSLGCAGAGEQELYDALPWAFGVVEPTDRHISCG